MKICCNVCNKYRKSKNPKISCLSIVFRKCGHEYKKIFKEEESLETLKLLGWLKSIDETRNKSKWINE